MSHTDIYSTLLWVALAVLIGVGIIMLLGNWALRRTVLDHESKNRLEAHLQIMLYVLGFTIFFLGCVLAADGYELWAALTFWVVTLAWSALTLNWWFWFRRRVQIFREKTEPSVTPVSVSTGSSRS